MGSNFEKFMQFLDWRPPALVRKWLLASRLYGWRDAVSPCLPLFLAAILLEFLASTLILRRKLYYARQTLSNLWAGVLSMTFSVFVRGLSVFPYKLAFDWFCPIKPSPAQTWFHAYQTLAILGCDLGYYLFHRFSHASNLGWAAHQVHHSSPDFNFSTALRQGMFESLLSWAFYLPMALVIPPEVYFFYRGVNTVYQFWVHSQLVASLGPLEWVLNTPSHHRVHHARNYPRCNFGAMLIVWDRFFGTFEAEKRSRPCVFGLDERQVALGTHNPLWHQLHHALCTLRLLLDTLLSPSASPTATLSASVAVLLTRRVGQGMIGATDLEAFHLAHGGIARDAKHLWPAGRPGSLPSSPVVPSSPKMRGPSRGLPQPPPSLRPSSQDTPQGARRALAFPALPDALLPPTTSQPARPQARRSADLHPPPSSVPPPVLTTQRRRGSSTRDRGGFQALDRSSLPSALPSLSREEGPNRTSQEDPLSPPDPSGSSRERSAKETALAVARDANAHLATWRGELEGVLGLMSPTAVDVADRIGISQLLPPASAASPGLLSPSAPQTQSLQALINDPARHNRYGVRMPPNDFPCDPRPLGWQDLYVTAHFLLVIVPAFSCLLALFPSMPFFGLCGTAIGIFVSLTAFGLLFDGSISALIIEGFRLLVVLLATFFLCPAQGYRELPLLPGLSLSVSWRIARRVIFGIHLLSLVTVVMAYSAAAALRALPVPERSSKGGAGKVQPTHAHLPSLPPLRPPRQVAIKGKAL